MARTQPLIVALLCCVAAQALALDAKEKRIVRAVDDRQAQALGLLAETVDIDSATENHAGVRKVGVVGAGVMGSGIAQAVMLPMLAFAALYFRYFKTPKKLTPHFIWQIFLIISAIGMLIVAIWTLWSKW